jgi:hypothetical protein
MATNARRIARPQCRGRRPARPGRATTATLEKESFGRVVAGNLIHLPGKLAGVFGQKDAAN